MDRVCFNTGRFCDFDHVFTILKMIEISERFTLNYSEEPKAPLKPFNSKKVRIDFTPPFKGFEAYAVISCLVCLAKKFQFLQLLISFVVAESSFNYT